MPRAWTWESRKPPLPPVWEGQPDAARLRAEQMRVLFQQQPVVVATNVAVAALVAVPCSRPHASSALPVLWLVAVLAVSAIRFVIWRRCWTSEPSPADIENWARLCVSGAAAAAALWGLGLALLFPSELLLQMVTILAAAGMCAGAAAALSCYRPAFYAFLFPTLLPLGAAARGRKARPRIWPWRRWSWPMPRRMTLVARNLGRAFARSQRLQLEKDALLARATGSFRASSSGSRSAPRALRSSNRN